MPMLGARPHSHEAITNSSMLRDEQAHLAEALRQPAGERHRDRVGHGERGDDPGALGRADAQVAGDRRDRHVGDRRVEHVHERRQRQRDRARGRARRRCSGAVRRRAPARAAGRRAGRGAARLAAAISASRREPSPRQRRRGAAARAPRRGARASAPTRRPRLAAMILLHLGVGLLVAAGRRRWSARAPARCATSASMRAVGVADVDLGVHRQADAQRMLGDFLRRRARCAPARAAPP